MSGEIAPANVFAEDSGRAGQNLGFGASDIGQQSLRRESRSQAPDQFDDGAHGRRQQDHLAASHRVGGTGVAFINRALCPAPAPEPGRGRSRRSGQRSARFFRASPKEPPMRPVPMMVIWRIAIEVTTETQSHRGKAEYRRHLHCPVRSSEDAKPQLGFLRVSVPLW